MSIDQSFADYGCELLQSAGPCVARRMFGGWGISVDGMTIAILANLGDGDTLWLKASDESRHRFEAEGCARFTYPVQGQPKSMNYYSAPAEAMESPALMLPWARLALEAALQARKPLRPKAIKARQASHKTKLAKPPRGR